MRRPRRATLALPVTALLVVGLAPGSAAAPARVTGTSGRPGAGDSFFPRQGNTGYDVASYDLRLRYYTSPKRIAAVAVIRAQAKQNLSRFMLDLRRNMHVSSVTVNGVRAAIAHPRSRVQELVVHPKQAVPKRGGMRIVVRYAGQVAALRDPNGSLDGMVKTADGVVVVAEPQGAPTWFPVNDSPRDKAAYRITVTAANSLVAVANGRYGGKTRHGSTTTWVWRQQERISSYLATVAIGKFTVRTGRTKAGIPYFNAADPTQRGAVSMLANTAKVVDYFSTRFGKYPFGATGGIIENANFLGYALETASRPVYDRTPSIQTLSHELAHQWFGDAVTLKRWRDIWLNEGFAQFASWLWDEHRGSTTGHQHLRQLLSVPASNTSFWNPPPANPGGPRTLFAGSVYDRGAGALQALREKVGNAVFFRILRGWVAKHRYGNAEVGQFVVFASRTAHRDLRPFFREWLYRPGKPRT